MRENKNLSELMLLAGICFLTQRGGFYPSFSYYYGISCLLDPFVTADCQQNKTRFLLIVNVQGLEIIEISLFLLQRILWCYYSRHALVIRTCNYGQALFGNIRKFSGQKVATLVP